MNQVLLGKLNQHVKHLRKFPLPNPVEVSLKEEILLLWVLLFAVDVARCVFSCSIFLRLQNKLTGNQPGNKQLFG